MGQVVRAADPRGDDAAAAPKSESDPDGKEMIEMQSSAKGSNHQNGFLQRFFQVHRLLFWAVLPSVPQTTFSGPTLAAQGRQRGQCIWGQCIWDSRDALRGGGGSRDSVNPAVAGGGDTTTGGPGTDLCANKHAESRTLQSFDCNKPTHSEAVAQVSVLLEQMPPAVAGLSSCLRQCVLGVDKEMSTSATPLLSTTRLDDLCPFTRGAVDNLAKLLDVLDTPPADAHLAPHSKTKPVVRLPSTAAGPAEAGTPGCKRHKLLPSTPQG